MKKLILFIYEKRLCSKTQKTAESLLEDHTGPSPIMLMGRLLFLSCGMVWGQVRTPARWQFSVVEDNGVVDETVQGDEIETFPAKKSSGVQAVVLFKKPKKYGPVRAQAHVEKEILSLNFHDPGLLLQGYFL